MRRLHFTFVFAGLIFGVMCTITEPVRSKSHSTHRPKSRTTPPSTANPKHQGEHKLVNFPDPTTKAPKARAAASTANIGRSMTGPKPTPLTTVAPTTTTTTTTDPTTTTTEPATTTEQTTTTEEPTTTTTTTEPTTTTTEPTTTTETTTTTEPTTTTTEPTRTTTTEPTTTTTEPTTTTTRPTTTTTEPTTTTEKTSRTTEKPPNKKFVGRSVLRTKPHQNSTKSPSDPFSTSNEWAMFNHRMDNLTLMLLDLMHPVYSIFNDTNEELKANRTEFLENFDKYFNEKHLKGIVQLLKPVTEELERNRAFTAINPAIDLPKISDVIAFAKTNPTSEIEKGRLKWMEVNSMAATIHHIFQRLITNFENAGGLEEVNRTMEISYPSWVTQFITNDKNNFKDLVPANLTTYIHDQMNIFGDEHHLIRILERLLNHSVLSNWNPSETSLNMYCYGNNFEYGQIHKKFDVLLDAALYLCLADMKFAILQMTNLVYSAWLAEKESQKMELETARTEIETTLKKRLERKYRLGAVVADKSIDTHMSPKKFKCDIPPKGCNESPHVTAHNCPPGVYVQDGAVFHNGTKLSLPETVAGEVTLDGKRIDCIGLELVPYDSNGAPVACFLKDGKCIDMSTETETVFPEYKVVLSPVLLDENRVPVIRTMQTPLYPKSSEWGILDCAIHSDLPAPDPPGGDCLNKTEGDGPRCGYVDTRSPNMTFTAQFSNAFPGYLESEMVLNPEGKCIGTCQNYKKPTLTCTNKTTHCKLYRQSHCLEPESQCMKYSQCPNQAKRCIRASREVSFCPAKEGGAYVYDWLKVNDKVTRAGITEAYGNGSSEECPGSKVMKVRERWEMESGVILKTPQYCELCLCVCSDPLTPEGQHYFDVSERMANTADGYVVTGLRFEQKNNTMSLNIQQGKIIEDGTIDASTLSWLGPSSNPNRIPLGNSGFLRMNLDEIGGKFTEVVTGLRWIHDQNFLQLEVAVTEFISKPPSASSSINFINSTSTVAMRRKFDLAEVNSPRNQEGPSQPYPITDDPSHFIEFDASSLEKDAGQSVVPFFDLQPITTSESSPVPIAAIGILFKSKHGSGGFLAPTLRTFVHPYIRDVAKTGT